MGFNTTRQGSTAQTYEGARAFGMNPKLELYTLVCTSMMSGDTFYESDGDRVSRFRSLVAKVGRDRAGAGWLAKLALYAREQMHLRTTPTILLAELFGIDEAPAAVAAERAWFRGDEHLEALAYTRATGQKRTKGLLRAVSAALNRMSEKQFIKYGATSKAFSQRDAIRLAHPRPKDAHQSALLKYVVKGWPELTEEERGLLPLVRATKEAGQTVTWEQHISDKGSNAQAWGEAVDKMGYMALLRNLRNLIEKGVPAEVMAAVAGRIANPVEVANSKQLPFRFYSAWRELPPRTDLAITRAVSSALDLATRNVPDLEGDSCVLVDVSGSMRWGQISPRSKLTYMDAAMCLGAIFAHSQTGGAWVFANDAAWIRLPPATPVLAIVELMKKARVGAGTHIAHAVSRALYEGRDYRRLIIATDQQSMDDVHAILAPWLGEDPKRSVYLIDMAGYGKACTASTVPGVHIVAGFSENVFDWINAVEQEDPVRLIEAYVP